MSEIIDQTVFLKLPRSDRELLRCMGVKPVRVESQKCSRFGCFALAEFRVVDLKSLSFHCKLCAAHAADYEPSQLEGRDQFI